MKKLFVHSVILLTLSAQIFGMEQPSAPKGPQVLLSRNRSVLGDITDAMNKVPSGGYVGIENPFLSNATFIKALKELPGKGVKTVVNLGGRSKKIEKQLSESGVEVHVIPNLHAKRCIIADKEPDKENVPESCSVFVGSHNMSNLAPNHEEIMIRQDNDPDWFMQHYGDHCTLVNAVEGDDSDDEYDVQVKKDPVKTTPAYAKIFNSNKTDLNNSKVARIKKLETSEHQGDCIDLTSMTFDSKEITDILEQVKNKRKDNLAVRLIFDRSALKHEDLLGQLHKAGVRIFIVNHEGKEKIWNKFPKLQHTKILLRKCDGQCLVIVSTGNLTQQSNRDINVDAYYPNNEQLFDEIKAYVDELEKSAVAYADILEEKKLKRERVEQEDIKMPWTKRRKVNVFDRIS